VQALCGNWKVARMLSRVPYPNPIELVENWTGAQAAAWKSGSAYNFAIEHNNDLIGVVGVSRQDDGSHEIGFWLGEPWWGQGLMTEAVSRVIDFTRAELGLDRLLSDYFADNPASGRIQEKCGFRIVGRGRLNSQSRGCAVDAVFTELVLSDVRPAAEAAS
jgi:RimJ/RimL family protein N-acetyltransferase